MPKQNLTKNEYRAARKSVRRMLATINQDVSSLPRSALIELYPTLLEAQKEVAKDLERWLAKTPGGEARFTAQRLRSLLIQLRKTQEVGGKILSNRTGPKWVAEIESKVFGTLRKAQSSSAKLATEHLIKELITFSNIFKDSLVPIDLDQAILLQRGEQALVPKFAKSAVRYANGVWDDMKRQLAIGVTRNETIDELTERLRKLGGPTSASAPAGLFRRYQHWAERVVRTEVINAYNVHHNEAINTLADEDPGIKKRWDSSLDSRLCVICRTLHGEIAATDKAFPGGVMHPPAHPNCRCTVVAWHKDWDTVPDIAPPPEARVKPKVPTWEELDSRTPERQKVSLRLRGPELPPASRIKQLGGDSLAPISNSQMKEVRKVFAEGQEAVTTAYKDGIVLAVRPGGIFDVVNGHHQILVAREYPRIKVPVIFVKGV